MYKFLVKRFLDFITALCGLILISPVFIITMICLWYFNRGTAFFTQERPGLNGKIFKVIKFKSMTDEKDINGELLPNKDRLTPFGSFIRKTSLDELPQLLNVLKGQMSFIGPRPLLVEYLPYYSEEEKLRHSIRPGISGLAQVNGRNNLSWEERLAFDVNYAKNIGFKLDCKIFWLTIKKVLKRDNVVVALDPKIHIPLNVYRKNKNRKA